MGQYEKLKWINVHLEFRFLILSLPWKLLIVIDSIFRNIYSTDSMLRKILNIKICFIHTVFFSLDWKEHLNSAGTTYLIDENLKELVKTSSYNFSGIVEQGIANFANTRQLRRFFTPSFINMIIQTHQELALFSWDKQELHFRWSAPYPSMIKLPDWWTWQALQDWAAVVCPLLLAGFEILPCQRYPQSYHF